MDRHRADFDVHEPRPDLWAAVAARLEGVAPALALDGRPVERPAMRVVMAGVPAAASRGSWLHRYGLAAGLALLVGAAGASEAWRSRLPRADSASEASARPNAQADAALYQSGDPSSVPAALGGATQRGDSQLTAAVRGMEMYYAAQLRQRETALRRLGDTSATPGAAAEWQRELVTLDSSYRLLKQELPRHPRPEALLTAMNRNLQVRLDILDDRLHLNDAPADATATASAYVLADSRRQP